MDECTLDESLANTYYSTPLFDSNTLLLSDRTTPAPNIYDTKLVVGALNCSSSAATAAIAAEEDSASTRNNQGAEFTRRPIAFPLFLSLGLSLSLSLSLCSH